MGLHLIFEDHWYSSDSSPFPIIQVYTANEVLELEGQLGS